MSKEASSIGNFNELCKAFNYNHANSDASVTSTVPSRASQWSLSMSFPIYFGDFPVWVCFNNINGFWD